MAALLAGDLENVFTDVKEEVDYKRNRPTKAKRLCSAANRRTVVRRLRVIPAIHPSRAKPQFPEHIFLELYIGLYALTQSVANNTA
ncbi:hypothetical protein HAX54_007288, partial [Datura stramonium]|nr:hypothetical protein [Datura stramonium]